MSWYNMKPTGGYFELELKKGCCLYHDNLYRTKSGRASLVSILNFLRPTLVHIPFYTCNSLLEPFEELDLAYSFYEINSQLEPAVLPELLPGEYFLYVNYMDVKSALVNQLSAKYKDRFIADCTQAFFVKGNGVSWYFNSCRKFFGVPDGSYLYVPEGVQLPEIQPANEDYTTDHLVKRFNGHVREGFVSFQQNEELAGAGHSGMSRLSEYLLSNIDFNDVIRKRRENYIYLHERLKEFNTFHAELTTDQVPISYPLVLKQKIDKSPMFARDIFIPTFWKDTQEREVEGYAFEKAFTDLLWPLPIDQRYNTEDMELLYQALISTINLK